MEKYNILFPKIKNTLQVFITNKCNKKCRKCFVANKTRHVDMNLSQYRNTLDQFNGYEKIILIGGEPLLCSNFDDILSENIQRGINTTVYTNGSSNLLSNNKIELLKNDLVDLRVGTLGYSGMEKTIDVNFLEIFGKRITVVHMLRPNNIEQLNDVAHISFNSGCRNLYLSSIVDMEAYKDFWTNSEDELSHREYSHVVRSFLSGFNLDMNIHVALRGIHPLYFFKHLANIPEKWGGENCNICRIISVFNDQSTIQCPLDISLRDTESVSFGKRNCKRHEWCVLQKAILKRGE